FEGLSCFRGYALGQAGGPRLGNTHLDIMDWGSRTGRQPDDLVAQTCRLLAAKRVSPVSDGDAFGILLHHRDHDAMAWGFLDGFLARATRHPAVLPTDPRALFRDG
ncbi:MAG: polysaccharide deacetylase, partial [Hyphomicrobiales bacterium]